MPDEYIKQYDAMIAIYKRIKQIGMENNPNVLSIRQAVLDIPAADVEPVRHGRWEETMEDIGWSEEMCAECSVCGEDYVLSEWSMKDFVSVMHYCPNCGAKMDKGVDDGNKL